MWRTYFVGAVVMLLVGMAGASEPKSSTAAIEQWIQQLAAEAFADREAASKALLEIGLEARAPIEAALMQPDISPELRARARELLEKLKLLEIRQNALQLSALLEQATLANRGKLDQAQLQTLLERLVQVWSDVSREAKSLPVTFKEVQPAGDRDLRLTNENAFVILDCGQFSSVKKCIVLAETAVEISRADECIIIAGNTANVTSSRNCIILAGEQIRVSDGENNLMLSGGVLQSSFPRKTVVGAARTLKQSVSASVVHLNSPPTEQRWLFAKGQSDRNPQEVRSEAIVLDIPERKNTLEDIITLTQVVSSRTQPLAIFQRKEGQGEYVARVEQEICAPGGPPLPELAGWKLMYCGNSGFAVFKKGEERAVLRVLDAH